MRFDVTPAAGAAPDSAAGTNPGVDLDDIVLHDLVGWYGGGYPWEAWAQVRREDPVYRYERRDPNDHVGLGAVALVDVRGRR